MTTKQTSIQLTQAQRDQLAALTAQGFGNTSDIIRIAIDRMFRQECTPSPAKAVLQIWQHRTSGEKYAILNGNGVEGACGPLYYADVDDIQANGFGDRLWDAELADTIDDDADAYRVTWPYTSG